MFDATTILAYKGENKAVIGGDGQVTFGNTVLKAMPQKFEHCIRGKFWLVLQEVPPMLLIYLICLNQFRTNQRGFA